MLNYVRITISALGAAPFSIQFRAIEQARRTPKVSWARHSMRVYKTLIPPGFSWGTRDSPPRYIQKRQKQGCHCSGWAPSGDSLRATPLRSSFICRNRTDRILWFSCATTGPCPQMCHAQLRRAYFLARRVLVGVFRAITFFRRGTFRRFRAFFTSGCSALRCVFSAVCCLGPVFLCSMPFLALCFAGL